MQGSLILVLVCTVATTTAWCRCPVTLTPYEYSVLPVEDLGAEIYLVPKYASNAFLPSAGRFPTRRSTTAVYNSPDIMMAIASIPNNPATALPNLDIRLGGAFCHWHHISPLYDTSPVMSGGILLEIGSPDDPIVAVVPFYSVFDAAGDPATLVLDLLMYPSPRWTNWDRLLSQLRNVGQQDETATADRYLL